MRSTTENRSVGRGKVDTPITVIDVLDLTIEQHFEHEVLTMKIESSKLLSSIAASILLVSLTGPASAANTNTTIQEGKINTNDTYQLGFENDNATYQQGLDNANRTRQRGMYNWNETGQFGKVNYNKTDQRLGFRRDRTEQRGRGRRGHSGE